MPVTLHRDAQENGLALMIAQLLSENLARDHARGDFDALDLTLGIVARDAGVSLTVDFSRGHAVVYDGLQPDCDVVVRADAEKITALTLVPIRGVGRARLPDATSPEVRAIARDLVRGRVRIHGLWRHPIALVRLLRVLSVAS